MKESFTFKGFVPDDQLRVFAQKTLDRIFSTSPSDATPVAFLEKTQAGFLGQVEVSSTHGLFKANIEDKEANKVIEKLNLEIKSQLDEWKKVRFL